MQEGFNGRCLHIVTLFSGNHALSLLLISSSQCPLSEA